MNGKKAYFLGIMLAGWSLLLPYASAAATESLPPFGPYDSQLGGAYPPPKGVAVISRDRTESPAEGLYNICYINAFQTQPGETAWWNENHPELLLRDTRDRPIADPDWPEEFLLDTRSPEKRQALAAIVGDWITDCAQRGFQAIEADNLDTYSRSKNMITMENNLAYAKILIEHATKEGLAFGQKNSAELLDHAIETGFDFAIVEECAVYDECDEYMKIYGRRILEIEYTDNGRKFFEKACRAHGKRIPVILRDRNLVPAGHPDYIFEAC